MQRVAMISVLILASTIVLSAGEAKAGVEQEVLQGAALRWLGENDDQIVVETSDETNETSSEEIIDEETTQQPDKVVIGGSMELSVEDPQAFCADRAAQAAIKAAIATAADADLADVAMQCTPSGRRLGEEAPAARRLAGSVTIDYIVELSSALATEVKLMDQEAWTQAINVALTDAGLETVTVLSITAPTVRGDRELPQRRGDRQPEEDLDDSGAAGEAFPAMSMVSAALAVLMSLVKQ